MSITATSRCFYCGNPINLARQPHAHATIRHDYKHGGSRVTDRNFHLSCIEKFEAIGGRPYNPDTNYEILEKEIIEPSSLRSPLSEENFTEAQA
jgi:hypothetical protein